MAWNIRGCKTEHAGAKHGSGAYWGRKADAKHASNKERRRIGRLVVGGSGVELRAGADRRGRLAALE